MISCRSRMYVYTYEYVDRLAMCVLTGKTLFLKASYRMTSHSRASFIFVIFKEGEVNSEEETLKLRMTRAGSIIIQRPIQILIRKDTACVQMSNGSPQWKRDPRTKKHDELIYHQSTMSILPQPRPSFKRDGSTSH